MIVKTRILDYGNGVNNETFNADDTFNCSGYGVLAELPVGKARRKLSHAEAMP